MVNTRLFISEWGQIKPLSGDLYTGKDAGKKRMQVIKYNLLVCILKTELLINRLLIFDIKVFTKGILLLGYFWFSIFMINKS